MIFLSKSKIVFHLLFSLNLKKYKEIFEKREKILKYSFYFKKMIKTIATLLVLIYFIYAQCPAGSTNIFNGQRTSYCYRNLGLDGNYFEADRSCRKLGYQLVTPKTDAGLEDLSLLTRSFNDFWVNYKKFIVHLR